MTSSVLTTPQLLCRQGLELHQAGQLAAAKQCYEEALRQDPEYFDALHLLGVLYVNLRQAQGGVGLIEKAIRLNPRNPEPYANLGKALNDLGRHEDALEMCDRAIALKPDLPEAYLNRAEALAGMARHAEALAGFDEAIRIKPDYADAHTDRAAMLHRLQRFDEAIASCDAVIALNPDRAEPHFNRAVALRSAGRTEEAIASFDAAIARHGGYADAHLNRGLALLDLKRPEAALAAFDKAIGLRANWAAAHTGRALVLNELARHEEALASCDAAIAAGPDYMKAHYARGVALRALERKVEALLSYDAALRLAPDDPATHNARAAILHELERYDEALIACDRVVQLKPDFGVAYHNRGIVLRNVGRHEEALASYEKALTLGVHSAEVHYNKSIVLRDLNRHADALVSCDDAIAINPAHAEALLNRSMIQLRLGRFDPGWREYECRKSKWHSSRPRLDAARQWMGHQDVTGKTVFVYHEQGLGDTIQFFRYVPQLIAMGAKVWLSTQDALRELLVRAVPQATMIGQEELPPRFDYHCPMLSLPLAFGTTLDTIPAPLRYLEADPARRARFESVLGAKSKPRIGVVWSGAPYHVNDRNRSIPFGRLSELFAIDAEWISLHKEMRPDDALALDRSGRVGFYGNEIKDFGDTAALVELTDLVVTVDTSVAHLAGALGKPVWVMLPFASDWRWLTEREDSPWYPSMRLFRQPRFGDWESVLDRVRGALLERYPGIGMAPGKVATLQQPAASRRQILDEGSQAESLAASIAPAPPRRGYDSIAQDVGQLLAKELFFIGAYPKSGTTWLQVILNAHPEISCHGEGHFLNHLAPLLRAALKKHNAYIDGKNRSIFKEFEGFPTFSDEAFQFLLTSSIALLLSQSPDARAARVVGEKTPDNIDEFPALAQLFPQAKFLHLVRDGRDCLVSAWFHNLRVNPKALRRQCPTLQDFMERFTPVWIAKVEQGLRFGAAHANRAMLVRYEDLLDRADETVTAVLGFLGVDAASETVRQCVAAGAFEKLSGGRALGVEDRSSFMRQGKSGNWREHLTQDDNEKFLSRAGAVMAHLGYR